jgi:hypothetical protein
MLTITAPVNTVTELLDTLERTAPRLRRYLDNSAFTLAVNGAAPINRVSNQMLKPGDRVDIVPA